MGAAGAPGTHDGHATTARDWPRRFESATGWPAVVAAGTSGLFVGLGLLLIKPSSASGFSVESLVLLAGLLAVVTGLLGWTFHGFVARHSDGTAHESRYLLGMLLFLVVEVATFGTGLTVYLDIRLAGLSTAGPAHLLTPGLALNTVLLVSSSATVHLADRALVAGRRRRFITALATTAVLGLVFLLGQVREYATLWAEGFTPTSGPFANVFFALTGLHGLHVALGVTLLTIVLARAFLGQYAADRRMSVTTISIYWHFVDAVWIVPVLALYVGGAVRL